MYRPSKLGPRRDFWPWVRFCVYFAAYFLAAILIGLILANI